MKKTFKFFAAALAIVAAASCAKETVATPDNLTGEKTPVTLSAIFNVDDETKATLAENNFVHWTDTDKIGVYTFGSGFNSYVSPFSIDPSSNDEDSTFAQFTGELVYDASLSYYAVLPANGWDSGRMRFAGLASQNAVKGSFDPDKHIAISEAATGESYTNYKFHNACALLKVTVAAEGAKTIKVYGEHQIDDWTTTGIGQAFDFSKGDLSVAKGYNLSLTEGNNKTITLTAKDSSLENGATYYIVVPHVTVKNFKVSLCDANGNVLVEKAKGTDFKIYRNKIYDLGTFTANKPAEKLEVNKTSLEFAAAGGTDTSIQVNSNVNWSVTTDADWLTVSKVNPYVSVTAKENTAAEPRTATITIKGEDLSKKITVTQAKAEVAGVKNYVEGRSKLTVSQLVDGGVYRIHKTSTSYVWYNDPNQSYKLTTPKTDGKNEGRLVVFTKKANSDSANSAATQIVGVFTDLYTNKVLTYSASENRLYFNGDGDGQWFTITDNQSTPGQVYIYFYGTSDYLATTGYDAYKYNKSQAFIFYEMIEQ